MLWLLLLLLFFLAAWLEASVQVDFHHFDETRARVLLRIGPWQRQWTFQLHKTPEGHRLVRTDTGTARPLDAAALRQSRSINFAGTLRRADKARRFLLSHLYLDRLDGLFLLRTGDAARSALLSGTMQGLVGCVPAEHPRKVRIRILPEFFRPHSTVQARCIIRFRLGTLILTAMMLLAAYIRQLLLTEREAMTYGTSHR